MMEGYKVFEPDWTCRGFQYEVGKTFEEDVTPFCCVIGFHFCKKLIDCFNYYNFDPKNKVAKVIALGEIDEEYNGEKCCTNKIQIVKEISWEDVLRMVNIGAGNVGLNNVGDCNNGDYNFGNYNRGNNNIGLGNIGDYNIGKRNRGSLNTGNRNIGKCNSGNYNKGIYNSGNCNCGDYNSGDWNMTDHAQGCFNTDEQTLYFFNKPSKWTWHDWCESSQKRLLDTLLEQCTCWIQSSYMTHEDKELHPEYKTTGGYLKYIGNMKCRQDWWDHLREWEKSIIQSMPNFDKEIFEEIMGIRI